MRIKLYVLLTLTLLAGCVHKAPEVKQEKVHTEEVNKRKPFPEVDLGHIMTREEREERAKGVKKKERKAEEKDTGGAALPSPNPFSVK